MIDYGIFPGSYVIVRQGVFGRILVTRYLAPCDEYLLFDQGIGITGSIEQFEAPLIPVEWLQGPTVKYYLGQDESGYHLLQGQTDSKRDVIRTRYIDPVGAVIGVYRVVA